MESQQPESPGSGRNCQEETSNRHSVTVGGDALDEAVREVLEARKRGDVAGARMALLRALQELG